MKDMFAKLILGHLAGDYLLQTKAMMLNKSRAGPQGNFWCVLHCTIYTATMCLFLGTGNLKAAIVIFASHYPIDRWSLADKWMALIKSRRPDEAYRRKEIDAAFYAIVYAVCDNAIHLILMWLGLQWILRRKARQSLKKQ